MIILLFILLINLVISVWIIGFKGRNPASSWAWLIFLILMPFFGIAMYILFGQDSRKIKTFNKKNDADLILDCEFKSDFDNCFYDANCSYQDFSSSSKVVALLTEKLSNEFLVCNNEVSIFVDGSHKFRELMIAIDNAKNYIHLEYYILRNDNLGRFLLNKLIKKAQKGVEVKLLVDAVGTFTKNRNFFEPLIDSGCKVAVFGKRHAIRINYRNHRKLCIIDGKHGFLGGFNIGDEYIYSRKFGVWRDTHIKIYGDAVKYLELQFIKDWNFCSEDKIVLEDKYFPNIPKTDTNIPMQILSSGPDTKWANIHYVFLKMISTAKDYVYITTPYLMPDESIINALKIASISGVDVQILIPSVGDHPFVLGGNLSNVEILLKAGVKCYMYKAKGDVATFIHSKQIIVDDLYTSLGTANFDYRSFYLNFEINSIMYDKKISINFREQFQTDLTFSEEITLEYFKSYTFMDNVKFAISRLLSPLL